MKHYAKEDKGSNNNERDRMLEDFWQRKKEAEANKARGLEAIAGPQVMLKVVHILLLFLLFRALRLLWYVQLNYYFY